MSIHLGRPIQDEASYFCRYARTMVSNFLFESAIGPCALHKAATANCLVTGQMTLDLCGGTFFSWMAERLGCFSGA